MLILQRHSLLLQSRFKSGRSFCIVRYLSGTDNTETVNSLCTHLQIDKNKAQILYLKHPVIKKLDDVRLRSLIDTINEIGFSSEALIKEPSMFGLLPMIIKFRFKVLQECGMKNVSHKQLASYLSIIKQKTIRQLKNSGDIDSFLNVENKLASHMSQWPTSLTTLIYKDINEHTLYELRLKIIQRYLELALDLTENEFYRGVQTYPTIKHRPLEIINETLNLLKTQIKIPPHKIKNNLYLIHTDPENLKQIIFNFKSIGGIDIKEIINKYPKIAVKNYCTLFEMRKVLEEYGISNEAQRRCFEIYTLGPSTVRERLENAKAIPEFETMYNHPRFLRMIYYNKIALKRLLDSYKNNKRCISLSILSGSSTRYELFEKVPGDRMGKGKDLIFSISQSFQNMFSSTEIRNQLRKHPYWMNIPIIQVKFVYSKLSSEYLPSEIFENLPILLYPWSKTKDILKLLNMKPSFHEHLDCNGMSKSQKLSLTLYFLEKSHYFSGNGVWDEEKCKSLETTNKNEDTSRQLAQ